MPKSLWDVLLAGFFIMSGTMYVALAVKQGERLAWYRHLGYYVASLGFICWGVGWVTVRHGVDLWPFMLMGPLGIAVGSGVFEGAKLSDLFPTFCRRRGPRS